MEHQWKFTFKIEPKPGGGFTATSDHHPDTLEGATQEEVEQKVRELLAKLVGPDLAAKIPLHTATTSSPTEARKTFDIVVKRAMSVTTGKIPASGLSQPGALPGPGQSGDTKAMFSASSGPIERASESSGSGAFIKFALLILAAIVLVWALSHR